jgi:hypothetical protein
LEGPSVHVLRSVRPVVEVAFADEVEVRLREAVRREEVPSVLRGVVEDVGDVEVESEVLELWPYLRAQHVRYAPRRPRANPSVASRFSSRTAQLQLLKRLDFPCCETVVASAKCLEEGVELSGSRSELKTLFGWVAGEANFARERGR